MWTYGVCGSGPLFGMIPHGDVLNWALSPARQMASWILNANATTNRRLRLNSGCPSAMFATWRRSQSLGSSNTIESPACRDEVETVVCNPVSTYSSFSPRSEDYGLTTRVSDETLRGSTILEVGWSRSWTAIFRAGMSQSTASR